MSRKFVIADQNAVSAEGHFQTYTNALACAAQALGCDVTVLWNKRFPIGSFPASYRMEAVFSCTEAEAAARRLIPYGEGHFGFELERALQPLDLRAQDHVVIHTCHFVELVEALDYLATLPPARDLPTFHIVVRYDPDVYRYRMSRLMQRLGAILRTPNLAEKLRLHSDTQQLATAFAALFGAPVGVCPIPVDLPRLLPAAGEAAARPSGDPLIATYLGTARSEKGYRDILGALEFLGRDYIATDRLHFVLQCSDRSIAGEAGLAEYQQRLEAFIAREGLGDRIELVKHIVEQQEYCALVARSDIVLLAYSPESYRFRSSSVLIEAMATGKVVVTREGSWMASRVGPDNSVTYAEPAGLGPALAQAVTRFAELGKGAKARQPAEIVSGDPATLARHFLDNGAPQAGSGAGSALLMIADGDDVAAGGLRASVFLERLSCFARAGVRAHVALITSLAADAFDARLRIADALRPYPLESVTFLSPDGNGGRFRQFPEKPAAIYLAEGVDAGVVEKLRLPDAPVVMETSSRACPFPLRPSRIEDLAGPVDGFELVASGDPLRRDLRIENRPLASVQDRYERFRALQSVDILLHATAPGAARWFLEAVHEPFLSARHVTVLAIGDVEPTPDVDGFLFVGRLADRDPLYAAAKIVVTTAGRDAPLAVFEALAKGKPTLLTGATAPGLEREGLPILDDPRSLAAEIVDLLESSERRASAAEQSRRAAQTLGVGQSDEVVARLSTLLGIAPPAVRDPAPTSSPLGLVEWSPSVRAANRFVRSILANEALDSLSELSGETEGVELIARIAQALVDDGAAPLLRVDGGLLTKALQRRACGGAAEIAEVAKIAIDAAGPAKGDAPPASTFVVNKSIPGEIVPGGERGGAISLRSEDQHGAELVSISLSEGSAPQAVRIRQDIPLKPGARALGQNIFANWSFERGQLVVREKRPSADGPTRFLERLHLRLQSFVGGWSPWATANQLFDAKWYVAEYPEAASAGIEPFRHYSRYGVNKGYRPNPFFDADWYARRYGIDAVGAWQHYLNHGADPQFDPGPCFSASRYLHENPDVAGYWSWSPLLHYTLLGCGEGRDAYPAQPLRPHQSLAVPVVIGCGGDAFVELVLEGPPTGAVPLALHFGDRRLDLAMRAEEGDTILRALLPHEAAATGLVHVQVSLAPGARHVRVVKLRTGWTSAA
jgi:glycosyltransferase involved in cell wall biosynthesis